MSSRLLFGERTPPMGTPFFFKYLFAVKHLLIKPKLQRFDLPTTHCFDCPPRLQCFSGRSFENLSAELLSSEIRQILHPPQLHAVPRASRPYVHPVTFTLLFFTQFLIPSDGYRIYDVNKSNKAPCDGLWKARRLGTI